VKPWQNGTAMSLTTAVSSFKKEIWKLLEGQLAAATRYQRARGDFALWQTRLGIETAPLAPDQLDVLLAKYVLDTKEECDSVVSRQQSIALVACTRRRADLPCWLAQRILEMVTMLSLMFKEQQAGILVLLYLAGCLRIGVALGLRAQDVFLPRPGSADRRGLLILRATERSFDRQGYSCEYLGLFGRWASGCSCREYIRFGQSALARISGRISQKQTVYETLGSAGDRAFGLAANGVVG
jgi:hypothetical protein